MAITRGLGQHASDLLDSIEGLEEDGEAVSARPLHSLARTIAVPQLSDFLARIRLFDGVQKGLAVADGEAELVHLELRLEPQDLLDNRVLQDGELQ